MTGVGCGVPRRRRREAEGQAVVDAVVRELEAAGQLAMPLGSIAVALAGAMGNPAETASGMAARSRELLPVLAAATADAPRKPDLVDQLRARRAARRAGLGGAA